MFRVVQISDTHLSRTKSQFAVNWPPLRDWVLRQSADLVIHTGDLTVDGAGTEDDMRTGAELMRSLRAPLLAVPGNHDVGEAGSAYQPVTAERLDRWRRYFVADRWSRDVEHWRLVGLDSMLFGNGDAEEAAQLEWLRRTLATADDRRIAWFMHRPLFVDDPGEGDTGYWSIEPGVRAALLDLVRAHEVTLIASGHLHKRRDQAIDGCRYVWCPSSAYLVGADVQPDMPGEKRLGAVVYEFHGSDVTVSLADVSGLEPLWIDDVIREVYPARGAGRRA